MRFGAVPENPIERVITRLNVAPRPLFETQIAYTLARVVMVATKLGVFEALAVGESTAPGVAERCGTDAGATEKLLFALAGADYVRSDDGTDLLDIGGSHGYYDVVLTAQLVHHLSDEVGIQAATKPR